MQQISAAITSLVASVGGTSNPTAFDNYDITEVAFHKSGAKNVMFYEKAKILEDQYGSSESINSGFRLHYPEVSYGNPLDPLKDDHRNMVVREFEKYKQVQEFGPHVKVGIAFHVTCKTDAEKILTNAFAHVQKVDNGYFGAGQYLTFDAHYAITEYGEKLKMNKGIVDDEGIALIICLVVYGNSYPIIEAKEYRGKSIVPKADSHIVVVALKDGSAPLPPGTAEWESLQQRDRLRTEIVLRESCQALPLCCVMLSQKP